MAASLKERIFGRILPFPTKVECEAQKIALFKRADTEKLKEIFVKYASKTIEGEKYMTYADLVLHYLQFLKPENYNEFTLQLIGSGVDTSRDGLVSFTEFQAFENLLSRPDAMYALAFQIFDRNGSGFINFNDNSSRRQKITQNAMDEFKDLVIHTSEKIPFNFECDFISLHFGDDKLRRISYNEFSQIIHDLHEEHAIQAFNRFDKDSSGYISAKDFEEIMISLKGYLLTPFVKEHLVSVAVGDYHKRISYAYFTGFISLLNNMELMKKIYLSASRQDKNAPCSKEELMYQAQEFPQITPMEIDILFQLVALRHQTGMISLGLGSGSTVQIKVVFVSPVKQKQDIVMHLKDAVGMANNVNHDQAAPKGAILSGRITYEDINELSPMEGRETPFSLQMQIAEEEIRLHQGTERTVLLSILESVYRFTLGSLAGATGATAVYPIDLVKTRLQNQRTGTVGELMYKNSFDCFKKVIRHEGFRGLYRGLPPQLVGVAPEKAIKLTVNDFMRDKLMNRDGSIPLWAEMMSGGMAGASQVMFTNPLEIVKIRLQVAGEIVGRTRVSAISVMKELGFFGLYKGSRACFLRDIPFSAIYFPAYAHMKKLFADENGYVSPMSLLCAATIAGAPAAAIPTPADVIKTRLQVAARTGQTTYTGVMDCIRKVYNEEGFSAFWKGAPARVFRSSPQFGVTLLTYELLQRLLYVDFGGRRPEGSAAKPTHLMEGLSRNPDHIGGYRLALATFDGMESRLGLCLPKFRNPVGT